MLRLLEDIQFTLKLHHFDRLQLLRNIQNAVEFSSVALQLEYDSFNVLLVLKPCIKLTRRADPVPLEEDSHFINRKRPRNKNGPAADGVTKTVLWGDASQPKIIGT